MHALSFFDTKIAILTTPNNVYSRKRKNRFRNSGSSPGISCQNQNLRHGFVSIRRKTHLFGVKIETLGSKHILALALDHVKEIDLVEKEKIDVKSLGLSLLDVKTADEVEEIMKKLDNVPLPVYSSIVRGLGFEKRLEPAFALVDWLKRKKRESNGATKPNLFIYNSLLGAIKQAKEFQKVDEVIEDMKNEGIVLNIVTYNTLMSVLLEQGKSDEALKILEDIERNGLSPSPVTYSTVLLAYREKKDALSAISFFVRLRKEYESGNLPKDKEYNWDVEVDKLEKFVIRICYLLMRQFLAKEDNPSTIVFKTLTEMDKNYIKLSKVEYERLIWACTRANHYDVARELYSRIRDTNSDISLSVCNHVIWLMGKAKKWWAALEIYEELLDKGPKPNNQSYELIVSHFKILLTAARRKGIWKWGVRLINKMLEKGLRPGTREWNSVLVACSKASETSAAVQIFKRMIEHGEKPTILSYGALLSALEKGKLYDEGLKVWDHMCKVGVKPNLHAYTILASIHVGKGNQEGVDSILKEMRGAGVEPSVVTYNAIISGCVKNQMKGVALEWFNRMNEENIKPNDITYDVMIEALARDGKVMLAYEMYLKACNERMNPSVRAYDAIVDSCRESGMNMNLDLNALGVRPLERKRKLKIRKDLSEFCDLADVDKRSKPFDSVELYTLPLQEKN